MQTEIVFAGFGGQGVLFTGQVLAHAAMEAGKEVTWFPSYGPEMRGGTANCTVIIADEAIGSPVVRNPRAVLAMSRPSLDKFEPLVKPGGTLLVNTSLIDRSVRREDLDVVSISATESAVSLGDKRMANMVMLGALLGRLPVVSLQDVQAALQFQLQGEKQGLLKGNLIVLQHGFAIGSLSPKEPLESALAYFS